MRDASPQSGVTSRRLPLWVYLLPGGIAAALVAIFVFDVPLRTVGTWAAFIAFFGLHFLMHGSHGGHGAHGSHGQRSGETEIVAPVGAQTAVDGPPNMEADEHESGDGCC